LPGVGHFCGIRLRMLAFVVRRIFSLAVVLLIAVTVTFCLLRMAPGSPFALNEKQSNPEAIARQERLYDLDRSILSQCARYLGLTKKNAQPEFGVPARRSGLLQGDMQPCLKYKDRSVGELIRQTLPVSAIIGGLALLIATVTGVWLGSIAALRKHTWVDSGTMFMALFAISIPTFVTGPALVLVFALWLGWLPVGGISGFTSLILPSVTLAGPFIAYIARLTRTSMLEVLAQDFVRTAHAKGLSDRRVIYKHVLKVAILPVVSFLGPLAAGLLTGSLVIEKVFSLPGMGDFFVNSVLNRDVFLCCGSVAVYCTLLVLMNLIVDVAYQWLDPRIRLS
jgi:oligopeptide transport system permease protein